MIDWSWPAEDLERFVRALSEPYPRPFAFYRGERIEVLEARVSEARYGGTPGRVIVQEGGGAVVSGPASISRCTTTRLWSPRFAPPDGVEHRGDEFFVRGGYLNDRI